MEENTTENQAIEASAEEVISYQQELYRKAIHLCSLSIPVFYALAGKWITLALLVPMLGITVLLDSARHKPGKTQRFVNKIFGNMLRAHEKDSNDKKLSGASYVLLAACICILFFPKIIGIVAFSVLVVSDTAAALIGRKYGKHRLLDKSVEGTLAFILSGMMVVVCVGSLAQVGDLTFYAFGTIAVTIGAIVEVSSKRFQIDDNISIPIAVGGVMLVLGLMEPGAYLGM